MKKKVKTLFEILLIILIVSIVIFSLYMKKTYAKIPFEELYFYMFNGVANSDISLFIKAITDNLLYIVLMLSILFIVLFDVTKGKSKIKIYPFKFINRHRGKIVILLFMGSITLGLYNLNFFKYIENNSTDSNFIELNYANPIDVNVDFEKKKNLIFIVVESLETTFFTKEQGGYWNYEVTPELYKLLNEDDSVTFYNKNETQGMKMITGASFTTASVFTNTSGLPFKVPIDGNSYHSENFMNGAYTLGDLLKDNGYYNEVITSATSSFGGIKEYFTKHGDYTIIDVDSAKKYDSDFDSSALGDWGLNDNYLYNIAKKRLTEISKNNEPFNLSLISIDTHASEGLLGDYSLNKYKTQYENVYATESKILYDFISWVKNQEFYKDTTIVIVGDHLSMNKEFFSSRNINNRYVYNCIINSYVNTENNSNREFSALDTFPTVVSSIGGKIEYDKLGLGINLFSNQKTLLERYSFDYVDEELVKKSGFYDKKIVDDDYTREKNNESNYGQTKTAILYLNK